MGLIHGAWTLVGLIHGAWTLVGLIHGARTLVGLIHGARTLVGLIQFVVCENGGLWLGAGAFCWGCAPRSCSPPRAVTVQPQRVRERRTWHTAAALVSGMFATKTSTLHGPLFVPRACVEGHQWRLALALLGRACGLAAA